MQPVGGMTNHSFPPQRLGVPAQTASSQPPSTQPIIPQPGASFSMPTQPLNHQVFFPPVHDVLSCKTTELKVAILMLLNKDYQ